MSRTHINCTINGDQTDFLSESGGSLLNALRDDVGLMGVKEGCGTGDCGACSVLMDDRVTCACLIFAPEAEGRTIVTIEGLANADELHPLQQCFLEGAALMRHLHSRFPHGSQSVARQEPSPDRDRSPLRPSGQPLPEYRL